LCFELAHGPGPDALLRFLERNGIEGSTVTRLDDRLLVDVPGGALGDDALRTALARHFGFMDLFFWVENGLEDVVFWNRACRWPDLIREANAFFPPDGYDVLATLEARGFFIAGILSGALGKAVIPVRKYREAFASFPGQKAGYRNWRGHDDQLWLQYLPWISALRGCRALFVDDVLETGNSLAACQTLLSDAGITVAGAFYLVDVGKPEVRGRFGFPVRSLLRMHGLRENTAPAAAG